MMHLYTDSSPNGFKISIALEELELPYQLHHVRIDAGEHRSAAFLKLNPHGRIPVLRDEDRDITLFESAAILLYLANKTQRLIPADPAAYWKTVQWLIFHASSVGPILGQRVHFEMFEQIPHPGVIQRYRHLTETTFRTLDQQLQHSLWIAGTDYSIADIAHFSWLHIAEIIGFNFSQFPHLYEWFQRVAKRPAVQRGISLPHPATGP